MLLCGHFAILATGVDNLTIDNITIDTNRDGRISREEFEAYLEKTRAKTP